jgi:micrococcal nuclease
MARPRRSYRSHRRLTPGRAVVFVLVLALIALLRWWQGPQPQAPPAPETLPEGTYTVQRVVDGDTIALTNGARVRLIGVNTPETVKPNSPVEPFGPEAKQFTQRLIDESHGQVRLQLDRERVDKYDRFLAYVWVDGRLLNEELVQAGLAKAELQYRYSSTMKTRFRRAEEAAQAAHRGIWSLQPAGQR